MSVSTATRTSTRSFSTRSSSSAISLSVGIEYYSGFGGGRSCMSLASGGKNRAQSVFSCAGRYGTVTSKSSFSFDCPRTPSEFIICATANEKETMQNLNYRLATYLKKVHSLEQANQKLELQIKEFYENRSHTHTNDLTGFFATITDLRNKIHAKSMENKGLILQIDNARLAAEDFRMKLEMETNMHRTVKGDVAHLKQMIDSFTLTRGELEMELEGLRTELVCLEKDHEKELLLIRTQQSGAVNVDVDCASSVDMIKVLEEMRAQYEEIVAKNHRKAAKWFESQVEELRKMTPTSTTDVENSQSQITELKTTFQSLEIELNGLITQKGYLENNVSEVTDRYSFKLSQLQIRINELEEELQRLNNSNQQQAYQYQDLLGIKMRLEKEITEYRQLLDREGNSRNLEEEKKEEGKIVKKPAEGEGEHKHHIQRRVRTIVQDLVDGEVVSSNEEVTTQEIS